MQHLLPMDDKSARTSVTLTFTRRQRCPHIYNIFSLERGGRGARTYTTLTPWNRTLEVPAHMQYLLPPRYIACTSFGHIRPTSSPHITRIKDKRDSSCLQNIIIHYSCNIFTSFNTTHTQHFLKHFSNYFQNTYFSNHI